MRFERPWFTLCPGVSRASRWTVTGAGAPLTGRVVVAGPDPGEGGGLDDRCGRFRLRVYKPLGDPGQHFFLVSMRHSGTFPPYNPSGPDMIS